MVFLLAASAGFGQNVSGSLSGTVQDTLQAVLPGVPVTLTDEQTGFPRTTQSNASGFFSFPDLTAATYTLSVVAPGFKRYEQKGIALNSGDQRSLGAIVLTVGEVTESVTVTAEAAPVQLGSSEKAGVVDMADSRVAPAPKPIQNIFILGGRSSSKNMTVDGVTNIDTGANGTVHSIYKLLKMYERLTAQLRLETYNTFNHTQFSSLSTSARFSAQGEQVDPLFLEPTGARSPRRMQLAVRLN